MAKRYLPPGYRIGVATFVTKLLEWRADPEHTYPNQTAEKIRDAISSLEGAQRQGFEDTLALWMHINMFEGGDPILDVWDPIKELEDAEYWRAN
ncbi:hypothetical protein WL28_28500 [Burkholderia ubonensis]|uniref:hypothetical protein n=1 Tax=Burkholderia ubonensis TaxID=101571 RepID=UPI0007590763|nr:hypothetical protein [Burkholderia ubonensis]KWA78027.1 hypothetical protein WL28_28500 [Burkholderia ubonensis]